MHITANSEAIIAWLNAEIQKLEAANQPIRMPTTDSLRAMLREALRGHQKSGDLIMSREHSEVIAFCHKELIRLGAGPVYLEELRRSDLIKHGFNPPEIL